MHFDDAPEQFSKGKVWAFWQLLMCCSWEQESWGQNCHSSTPCTLVLLVQNAHGPSCPPSHTLPSPVPRELLEPLIISHSGLAERESGWAWISGQQDCPWGVCWEQGGGAPSPACCDPPPSPALPAAWVPNQPQQFCSVGYKAEQHQLQQKVYSKQQSTKGTESYQNTSSGLWLQIQSPNQPQALFLSPWRPPTAAQNANSSQCCFTFNL